MNKMENLKKLALSNDKTKHIDMFSIVYFANACRKLLFFGYLYDENKESFDKHYYASLEILNKIMTIEDAKEFFNRLVEVREILETDVDAMLKNDPSALSKQEIVLCYPGVKAIAYYRIAHLFYAMGYQLEARIITEYSHKKTQIDIHPACTIGKSFSIDHGTGVVIGETAIIGNNVRIYQGVTLGAKWLNDASKVKNIKRHPTIEDNVIIYANATILGGDTVIKNGSVIGANAFILDGNLK